MVNFAVGIYHLPQAIALPLAPVASVHAEAIGVPTLPEAVTLVVFEVTGVEAPVGVIHNSESMA